MEQISQEQVLHVAKLSMLKVEPQEIANFQGHLSKILHHVNELSKIETENVIPLNNPIRDLFNQLSDEFGKREDTPKQSLPVKEILKNAPDQKLNQFKIEAVIADGE